LPTILVSADKNAVPGTAARTVINQSVHFQLTISGGSIPSEWA
jgi:hypothetical protein